MHGRDDARHLLGGYATVTGFQAHNEPRLGLSNAAFWVHQRQDVYNAILNQRLPKTDLERSQIDRSTSPADGCVWAKRSTCLQAEIVAFCLGPEAASASRYKQVLHRLDAWYSHNPDDFTPVYFRERDPSQGRWFPDVCFLLDYCGKSLARPTTQGPVLICLRMTSIRNVVLLFLPNVACYI